ncbi:EAL domain-containing protein [Geodermatophilus sabuli]|uniref:EAL domain-containing protein n=1 Tax=Geodermatophilus sabuli TaxID=1564158 RepID=A0A7K3W2Z0_9ACTN|nr:EAL domain-containing protein [Geodermatophilus sabuli]NEK58998.1 EAL domain-containing protein [Geodermatophilus sabuli]
MSVTRTRALPDCRPLLADPGDLSVVFQPIVDLAAARVVGYQALSRFPGTAGPDVWLAAAAECGLAAELEALAIARALDAVPLLPDDTSLTVGVSPHLLGTRPVREALDGPDGLHRVVVELTGHIPVADLDAVRSQTAALRARGALVALDGAGSGHSGLQQMATIRPELVTLDRALVTDVDTDPVQLALAELVGGFAGRIDARLLARGVETPGQLAVLARLGIPLARGWLLGRPSPVFQPLAPEVTRLVHAQVARARVSGSVAGLLRPARQCEAGSTLPGVPPAVLLGQRGEPVGLLLACPRTAAAFTAPVSLRVPPTAGITETLQRALTRPPAQRFDPVVCTDATGTVLGLLRIEDLVTAAACR